MARIESFRDLQVWQKAHELTLAVYKVTKDFPQHEIYGLTSQFRRAAVSVAANIVEGFRRSSLKDSLHFYAIAHASIDEARYYIILAKDLGYNNEQDSLKTSALAEEVSKLLTRWIQSQSKYV